MQWLGGVKQDFKVLANWNLFSGDTWTNCVRQHARQDIEGVSGLQCYNGFDQISDQLNMKSTTKW